MKAGPIVIGQLLQSRHRFCVPIYQRHYVWNRQKQWEPFWNDIRTKAIERLAGRERRFSHFMGAVVLEARGGFSARRVPSFQVVDGQQRLTTFQLFLAAARDYANAIGYTSGAETISTYLVNRDPHLMEDAEVEIFKVWPTQYDREMFTDIINLGGRKELRRKYSEYFFKTRDRIHDYRHTPKLIAGYGYFYDQIRHAVETDDLDDEFFEVPEKEDDEAAEIGNVDENPNEACGVEEGEVGDQNDENSGENIPPELRLDAIWQALVEEFKVVEINLEEGDDAQVIFETLNERGEPLLAADLVRNNIFQRADAMKENAEKLFAAHWKLFEDPFWSQDEKQGRYKKPRIEFFVANYIAGKIASEVNLTKLFSEYKAFIKKNPFASVSDELKEISRFGGLYFQLTNREGDSALAEFARRLLPWEVSTVFPLVLRLWDAPNVDENEKVGCLDILLSFIVRRGVCGLTTKNYNKFFLTIIAHLDKNGWSRSNFETYLLTQKSETGRMPRDDEFKRHWCSSPIYGELPSGRVRSILLELEMAKRSKFQETTAVSGHLTVEHMMPSSWGENWLMPDGTTPTSDEKIQAMYAMEDTETPVGRIVRRNRLKNTIGNLTILTQPLNSSVSNGPYEAKRKAISEQSLLVLNNEITKNESWSEVEIEARSEDLFATAKTVWLMPETILVEEID